MLAAWPAHAGSACQPVAAVARRSERVSDNHDMETTTIPSDVLADMERATELAVSGKKDLEFERRVQAEAKKIREEIFKKHGLLDIGVHAIRELRDGE
jgi:hypothetical protein